MLPCSLKLHRLSTWQQLTAVHCIVWHTLALPCLLTHLLQRFTLDPKVVKEWCDQANAQGVHLEAQTWVRCLHICVCVWLCVCMVLLFKICVCERMKFKGAP